MIKTMPQFELWNSETVVQFAKDAWVHMKQQEKAIEQLRADLRDAMRLLREKQDART